MRRITILFILFFSFNLLIQAQDYSGKYKINGDSYTEGTLLLKAAESESSYSFTLTKKSNDCDLKTITGFLNFNSEGVAAYTPLDGQKSDSCSMIFKQNADVISVIVNCDNNIDYLCSLSGRYILIK